jgi:hypothetical protein
MYHARTIGAITEAYYVAFTRMATNVLFAGIETTRATTNYTRQNTKEAAARITSNTAKGPGVKLNRRLYLPTNLIRAVLTLFIPGIVKSLMIITGQFRRSINCTYC